MNSAVIFNQVLILFLIILLGYVLKKADIMNKEVNKKLSELLLKVTSPFLVITSFQFEFSDEVLTNVGIILLFAVAAHALSIILGLSIFRMYPADTRNILKFSAVYSNCAFMGYPVIGSVYGKVGILYASVYAAVFNVFLWTHGVMLFSKKKDPQTFRKALVNPGITSVVIGIALFLFSVKLPAPIAEVLDMVGSMTVPLSMLIVGCTLAEVDFKSLLSGFPVYYASIIRLILIPLATLAVLKAVGFSEELLGICVMLVAVPVAATTTIFAEMFGGDSLLASRVVTLSTLASIITMPLIMMLI